MTSAHVYIGTSLDGFIARSDGSIDWLVEFADQDAVDAYDEFLATIDAIVIGRGTYETVAAFPTWPYDKPVFALSGTIKELPEDLRNKATVLAMNPAELLKYLSGEGYRSLYIDGGKVIQSFLAANVIDTLTIARVPVLIGSGLPLFGLLNNDLSLVHLRTSTYPNGIVRSYYRRKREI